MLCAQRWYSNQFICQDFPRLSVDIDLVYLPMKSRDDTLQEICDALRLIVARNGVQIKVELSPVLRGTVYEPKLMEVCAAVEDEFGYVEMSVVDLADLYAGKICAALDRQHPRDLFDVKWLLENEGLTDEIRKA